MRAALTLLLNRDPTFAVIAEATDGAEAIALAEGDERPDILLLDLNMPRTNGFDVLRRLRHACPGLTIVVHSAEHEHSTRAAVAEIGEYEYIVKGDSDLMARMRRIAARIEPRA